jgi:hypothetical protein
MKYTRSESGAVVEVLGCTKCPHKVDVSKDDENFMQCCVLTLRADGKARPIKKKLIGKWTGAYHASCPLASDPKQVPIFKEDAK